jgi:hypothetical protein
MMNKYDYTGLIDEPDDKIWGRATVWTRHGGKIVEIEQPIFRGVGSAEIARVFLKSTPEGWVPTITCLVFADGRTATESERLTLQEAAVSFLNDVEGVKP